MEMELATCQTTANIHEVTQSQVGPSVVFHQTLLFTARNK